MDGHGHRRRLGQVLGDGDHNLGNFSRRRPTLQVEVVGGIVYDQLLAGKAEDSHRTGLGVQNTVRNFISFGTTVEILDKVQRRLPTLQRKQKDWLEIDQVFGFETISKLKNSSLRF